MAQAYRDMASEVQAPALKLEFAKRAEWYVILASALGETTDRSADGGRIGEGQPAA